MIRIVGRLFLIRVAGATTAVSAEVAFAEPFSFLPVAPTTSRQFVPSTSHRCHWNANESGLPLQLPGLAVSSRPTRGVPEIVGGEVFLGMAALAAMTAVGADCAIALPSGLV